MIELVVCDMAGTTVEDGNAVNDALREALGAFGVSVRPDAVNAVMGLPKPEAISRLLSSAPHAQGDVAAIHAHFVERMKHHYATSPEVREVPGASATFAALRRAGVKVALNTGFGRSVVDVILRRLGWEQAVDASVASDEVERGRPHPDMIHHLMRRLGIKDARVVAKVGDTPVDLEEGFNAGCAVVIAVTTGSFTRRQLQAHRHSHILDSVSAVSEVLAQREVTRGQGEAGA